MQEENSKLKEQLKQSNQILEVKDKHIEENSVRVDENRRMLYIVEIDEDTCKLVADSHKRPHNIIREFVFPASMNIKKALSKKLGIKYPYYFSRESYDNVINEIKNLKPKNKIIVDNSITNFYDDI